MGMKNEDKYFHLYRYPDLLDLPPASFGIAIPTALFDHLGRHLLCCGFEGC